MSQTIKDIKSTRTDDTHLVNVHRVHAKYRAFNHSFREEDHSDLLLPANREIIAPEYRALLNKNPTNATTFATTHLDETDPHREWVVLTERYQPEAFLRLVDAGMTDPLEIRAYFEGLRNGNGEFENNNQFRRR